MQSEHPPTHCQPSPRRCGSPSDELLGLAPVKRAPRAKDSRLQRRLQQIEKLDGAQRRQIMQVLDTLLESAQLKRKNEKQAA